MPTYSYSCKDCGHAFDIQQAFSDDALTVCPNCSGTLRKVFSAVGVVFKGSGFYRTDSRGSGSSSASSSTSAATSSSGDGAGGSSSSSTGSSSGGSSSGGTAGASSGSTSGASTSSTASPKSSTGAA